MNEKYRARVFSSGARNGHVRSDDGVLDLQLSTPKVLGGKREATNPEQLFAAAYAACFENALQHIARIDKLPVKATAVEAEVALYETLEGTYKITVALNAHIRGIDQQTADNLAERAHGVCPYSDAVRNNVNVNVTAIVVS